MYYSTNCLVIVGHILCDKGLKIKAFLYNKKAFHEIKTEL